MFRIHLSQTSLIVSIFDQQISVVMSYAFPLTPVAGAHFPHNASSFPMILSSNKGVLGFWLLNALF